MSNQCLSRAERLEALRVQVNALVPGAGGLAAERLPFAIDDVDTRLGGGLLRTALHEVTAETTSLADDAAATLFVAGVAAQAGEGMVLWIMTRSDLFAPGLSQAGLKPARLIQVDARRDEDVLAVMEDGLRHGALSAVIGEVAKVGMTATRRLQLAAEEGATAALLLRRWPKMGLNPLAQPSAAVTRWRIGCLPSTPLPVEGVGRARWRVSLVRQRGGEPATWEMEGCDAQGRLALPADARDRSAAPFGRALIQAA